MLAFPSSGVGSWRPNDPGRQDSPMNSESILIVQCYGVRRRGNRIEQDARRCAQVWVQMVTSAGAGAERLPSTTHALTREAGREDGESDIPGRDTQLWSSRVEARGARRGKGLREGGRERWPLASKEYYEIGRDEKMKENCRVVKVCTARRMGRFGRRLR